MTRPRGSGSNRSLDAKQLGPNGPGGTCSARGHPAGQALVCSMKHNSTLRRCARKGVWMPSRHCPQEQDARAGEKYCSRRREVTQRLGARRVEESRVLRGDHTHGCGVAYVSQMCIKDSRCLLTLMGAPMVTPTFSSGRHQHASPPQHQGADKMWSKQRALR